MYKSYEKTIWSLIILAYFLAFIGPFTSNAILAIIAVLEDTFSVSVDMIALSITLYLVPFSVVQLFSGAISDKIGYFKGILIGSSIFALSSFYVAISPNIYHFILARFLQGIGAAFLTPLSMALLGDFSPPESRGKIMSGYAVAATAGISSSPIIAGYLAIFNWRFFFHLVAIGTFVFLTILFGKRSTLIRYSPASKSEDIIENIKIALSDKRLIVLGLFGFLIFFFRISFYTYLSKTLSSPPYYFDPVIIGSYISAAGFAGLLSSPIAGFLIDNLGKRFTALIASTLLCITFSLYFLIDWIAVLYILIIMMGLSITTLFITFSTIVVDINPRLRSTYSSVYNFLRFIGYSLGPTLTYPIYAQFGFYGILTVVLVSTFIILLSLMTRFMAQFEKSKM